MSVFWGGFATLDIRPCRKCGAAWSERWRHELLLPSQTCIQTSLWKQSLGGTAVFNRPSSCASTILQFKGSRKLGEGRGAIVLKNPSFYPPPHQHWPSSSMQSLWRRSIGSTQVQPPGGSVRLALLSGGCKPPLWGVSSGPGSGRRSGSGASGHLSSESEEDKQKVSVEVAILWSKVRGAVYTPTWRWIKPVSSSLS